MSERLTKRFELLKNESRGGLITFLTAGDPNAAVFFDILKQLPNAGADVIEIGMPFSDPVADGPIIQSANLRAIQAGITLTDILQMVSAFRESDSLTPIILMGYYNPVYSYGVEKFTTDAAKAGVDGLIIVDLPPEENEELHIPAKKVGLDLIHLITPTTDKKRLDVLLQRSSGFLYYVTIAGITGTKSAAYDVIHERVKFIRESTDLPIAVGFGVKTNEDVVTLTQSADCAVVGSAIVQLIETNLNDDSESITQKVIDKVKALSIR